MVTRILWSGLSGRVGRAALQQIGNVPNVEIVAGLRRELPEDGTPVLPGDPGLCWYSLKTVVGDPGMIDELNGYSPDVLVDFSHADACDQVIELARELQIPLIIGTSGLSDEQRAALQQLSVELPVFYGGNFQMGLKRFVDDVVAHVLKTGHTKKIEHGKSHERQLLLQENFYEGKRPLPSTTSRMIQQRLRQEAHKQVRVVSDANLPADKLECRWEIDGMVHYTSGFGTLTHDVMLIAQVMANKDQKPNGGFYSLDDIWDELVQEQDS